MWPPAQPPLPPLRPPPPRKAASHTRAHKTQATLKMINRTAIMANRPLVIATMGTLARILVCVQHRRTASLSIAAGRGARVSLSTKHAHFALHAFSHDQPVVDPTIILVTIRQPWWKVFHRSQIAFQNLSSHSGKGQLVPVIAIEPPTHQGKLLRSA